MGSQNNKNNGLIGCLSIIKKYRNKIEYDQENELEEFYQENKTPIHKIEEIDSDVATDITSLLETDKSEQD
jgi:hypothetical protein